MDDAEGGEKLQELAHVAPVPAAWRSLSTRRYRLGAVETGKRAAPVESAIALSVNGSTEAVMMATPADLEDFALGFLLTEGLIETPKDLVALEIIETLGGMEARMWLRPELTLRNAERRRRMMGPTGCGLCGIESLEAALRRPKPISPEPCVTLSPPDVAAALDALEGEQALGQVTRAVHAAGFWSPEAGLVCVREDVGRHNALDKLAGALVRSDVDAGCGAVVLTSRVSVEMVQKTCAIGAPVLIAVSAPTTLALDLAAQAGLCLIGVARKDGFELFCDPAGRLKL